MNLPDIITLSLGCAFMIIVLLLYFFYVRGHAAVKAGQQKGLSDSDLKKLPKVTGKDLALADDCAICLDKIEDKQPAKMVPGCNHGFHLKCADAWLSKNPTCPICRAAIGPEFFNPRETNPC